MDYLDYICCTRYSPVISRNWKRDTMKKVKRLIQKRLFIIYK